MTKLLALAALLLLAGCTSPTATPLAGDQPYTLDSWDWCSEHPQLQCMRVRVGNDLFELQPGGRISNGPSVDIWTRRGVLVDALSLGDE